MLFFLTGSAVVVARIEKAARSVVVRDARRQPAAQHCAASRHVLGRAREA
ncbi:hypothetical protein [Dokdonella sp.]|nr:hypothetical protein [Dokdonella sp.]